MAKIFDNKLKEFVPYNAIDDFGYLEYISPDGEFLTQEFDAVPEFLSIYKYWRALEKAGCVGVQFVPYDFWLIGDEKFTTLINPPIGRKTEYNLFHYYQAEWDGRIQDLDGLEKEYLEDFGSPLL
tara:strand:+ start:324 stop:698 length:375 start_codon:yes stop_codon:yes gene_type:complete